MSSASLPLASALEETCAIEAAKREGARLRAVIDGEHAFVWRSVRRLGVPMTDVDDAVQKVFLVAARRLPGVPVGRERAFLFATATRVASNERRGERRKRATDLGAIDEMASPAPSPEQVASNRAMLDAILDPLPIDLRVVVVLYELEQMTTDEIGQMLDLPPGTVASRLRRARGQIDLTLKRMKAQEERPR